MCCFFQTIPLELYVQWLCLWGWNEPAFSFWCADVTHISSISLVGFCCGRGRRIWQYAETQSLPAVLVLLVAFTACDLSIDCPRALINHSIKLLLQWNISWEMVFALLTATELSAFCQATGGQADVNKGSCHPCKLLPLVTCWDSCLLLYILLPILSLLAAVAMEG